MPWPHSDSINGISDHQRVELANALRGNVGCLSGGPGTGKTHTLAALIKSIYDQKIFFDELRGGQTDHDHISVCAPTGKAAVRITEQMLKHDLFIHATTMHSLLEINRNGHDGEGWGFMRNENNPLDVDFLFVEEASMMDTDMCSHLLAACKPGTHILFVGDPDQLPPVGHGKPFLDMIDAGLPHAHLTEIHRFAGRIALVCDSIRTGKIWVPSERIDLEAAFPENVRHYDLHHPMQIIDVMLQVVRKRIDKDDLIDDIQVICAVNEKSQLSRKVLNGVLQETLNPRGLRVEKCPFRVGDKVACGRNTWFDDAACVPSKPNARAGIKPPIVKHYIANGDVGIVNHIEESAKWIQVNFSGRFVCVPRAFWEIIDLAYAVTCHKSQGSQWKNVIVLADDYGGANMVCSRAWWYTAGSRAAKLAVFIGPRTTIDRHCRNVSLSKRNTFLKHDLELAMI